MVVGRLMPEQETRYVLVWHWSDNSAHGVTRVYSDETRAKADLQLAQEAEGSRNYELLTVPYFRGVYERD